MALVAFALGGCAPGGDDGGGPVAPAGLTPTFPVVSAPTSLPGSTATTTAPGGGEPLPTTAAVPSTGSEPPPPTTASPPTSASITDPEGDLTPSVLTPPPWADIVGGRLVRTDAGFELRIAVGGGAAPEGSGSPDETLNLASFYDVDGDGIIDFEVWANLADGGWGGSWFDNRDGGAAFGDDADVAVSVDGADVVLRFPLEYVDGSSAFRWSLASEWGRYETIGTDLAARDDAPDDDRPASFPS